MTQPSEDLVERVARAICGSDAAWDALPEDKKQRRDWRYSHDSTRDDYRDDARAALAAMPPLDAQAMRWEPIKTAPINGTIIDLWKLAPDGIHGNRVPDARWDNDRSFNGGIGRIAQPDAWVKAGCRSVIHLDGAVATGARMTALLELKWDQVDLQAGRIDLNQEGRVQTSKGRPIVPINAQLNSALTLAQEAATSDYVVEFKSGQVGAIKTAWKAAVRRSGVQATPHMLRHSAAVWMAEAGQPMAVIAQYLGHTDSRITERTYARFSPDFLKGASEALTW